MTTDNIVTYQCPCCAASLVFESQTQKMTCPYCENEFDLDTVRAFAESQQAPQETVEWEAESHNQWDEAEPVQTYLCSSCAGEILADEHTAATFCPYCGNPTILGGRVSGDLKPDLVIPFQKTRQDAINAFLAMCKGKPLLPRFFTQEQQLEKITGVYVPFWLYDCSSRFRGRYNATRIHTWSDSRYIYTKTDHYHLVRAAEASFCRIPMDASSKMDDTVMESIEPYDYSQLMDFKTAYLSGYLADKYDVPSKAGEERIRDRVRSSMDLKARETLFGYQSTISAGSDLHLDHSKASYVLLPVWMLHTRYKDKIYIFAMNGQTGKLTGTLPICPKRTAGWFAGIFAGVTALMTLAQMLF